MARRNTLSKRLADLDSKPKSSGPPMPGQRQEDDKPIDGVVFVMMNLIVLFGIIVAAVFFGTNSIESSIENEIPIPSPSGLLPYPKVFLAIGDLIRRLLSPISHHRRSGKEPCAGRRGLRSLGNGRH